MGGGGKKRWEGMKEGVEHLSMQRQAAGHHHAGRFGLVAHALSRAVAPLYLARSFEHDSCRSATASLPYVAVSPSHSIPYLVFVVFVGLVAAAAVSFLELSRAEP